jgi:hypothetical protein
VYVFRGLKDGTFAAVERLKDTSGNDYVFENVNASSVGAADWDKDGDVDLVVGYISGPMYVLKNESKDGKVAFGDAVPLMADGKHVEASDAGPCLADWDGDGVEDLILGDGEGGVRFFRAHRKGDKGFPELAAGEWLIEPRPANEQWTPLKADRDGFVAKPRIGVRTKPSVGDWNGDGKLDLLVGDYSSVEMPERDLNAEDKAKMQALKSKEADLVERSSNLWDAIEKKVYERMGLKEDEEVPDARNAEYDRIWQEISAADPEYGKVEKQLEETSEALASYESRNGSRGYVWVYLRK